MTQRTVWFIGLLFAFHCSYLAAAIPEGAFDLSTFRALKPEQKLDFVLAMLDARDSELQNVDYKVFETHVNVAKSGGARRIMGGCSYEGRRLGTTLWMHVQLLRASTPDDVIQDSIQNWDGKTGRRLGLSPTNGRSHPDGQIMREECQCFSFQRYSALLGFRVRLVQRAVPTSQWLRECRANPNAAVVVSDAMHEGAVMLNIHIDESGFHRELWIDPIHGFMIVQYDQVYLNHTMDTLLRATEIAKIDGIWLPKRAIGHNTTEFVKEFTEITHDLQEFHRGGVKSSDVEVPFPTGSSVIDLTRNISYTILPEEQYRLAPFANPAAKSVYKPIENKVVGHIDDSVSKMYVTMPLSTPDLGAKALRYSLMRRWIVSVAGCGAVAIVYLLYWRRRRRNTLGKTAEIPADRLNGDH